MREPIRGIAEDGDNRRDLSLILFLPTSILDFDHVVDRELIGQIQTVVIEEVIEIPERNVNDVTGSNCCDGLPIERSSRCADFVSGNKQRTQHVESGTILLERDGVSKVQ